jgi:hypothetical protein
MILRVSFLRFVSGNVQSYLHASAPLFPIAAITYDMQIGYRVAATPSFKASVLIWRRNSGVGPRTCGTSVLRESVCRLENSNYEI